MAKSIPQALACLPSIAAVATLLTFGVGVWIVFARPFELPRDKALRLCGECGLDVAEIDQLIDDVQRSTLSRVEGCGRT